MALGEQESKCGEWIRVSETWTRLKSIDLTASMEAMRAKLLPATLLGSSLGIVYLWFGALKLIGLSPALELIRRAYPPMATTPLYIALAVFELALGIALLSGYWKRWTAGAVIFHLFGTFGVLLSAPQTVFLPRFPFLTLEGEFVVKNLVLLAAAVVIFIQSEGHEPYRQKVTAARAGGLALFFTMCLIVGFAAAQFHHTMRVVAQTTTDTERVPVKMSTASVSALIGSGASQPIELNGVIADRCPLLGCWLKLRDHTGELFVDLAPTQLTARGIPLHSVIRVRGRVGKTREGQVGFVAGSLELLSAEDGGD